MENRHKIAVLDGHALNSGDLSWDWLREMGDAAVYDRTAPEDVLERAGGCDIIFTNKVPVDAALMDSLPALKYIGVLATGYNLIDIAAAAQRGITVTNIPSYGTMSVAQAVFALLLALTNHAEHYSELNRKGKWSSTADFCYRTTSLTELDGKTFGVYGLGHTGMAVARIARVFGMNVVACTSKSKEVLPGWIGKTDLEGLFQDSDVVSLHCPLTPETEGLVNRRTLSLMKPSAYLINTSRGPVVDEQALADALNRGQIAGAGLDVLAQEPPEAGNPLLSARNCVVTPHIAWATKEARARLMSVAESNLRSFLEGRPVNTVG